MNACYGISGEEIARRCRVSIATARRWKRGDMRIPDTAAMILSSDLGQLDPAWCGWVLRDGKLISPEGCDATPGDVLSLRLLRSQLAAYQAEKRQLMAMDEQPQPGAIPAIVA